MYERQLGQHLDIDQDTEGTKKHGDHREEKMTSKLSRRVFMQKAAQGSAVIALSHVGTTPVVMASPSKPALLGGTPVCDTTWPQWPNWQQSWEPAILDVLRSGRWWRGRGGHIADFEKTYAELVGSRRCLATASGTTALLVSLHVLDVDAGDEVIVSPFTFIASYNAILLSKALPIFADTDPDTLTIHPKSIESKITERTKAIMPVHIYGLPCDMDSINQIARSKSLVVIEDACQAWLAEYKGTKCGVLGDLGCFSFQNSKHLPTGEGGAITGNDEQIMDRCHSFHNCGRAFGTSTGIRQYFTRGSNRRMQQMQAVMLIQQIEKLVKETSTRRENADYLTNHLKNISGIMTVQLPEESKAVWHVYPFRYDSKQFNDLPRSGFIRALEAEGIPCSAGYHEQYYDGLLDEAIHSRGYKRLFPQKRLDDYRSSFEDLKGNKIVCETTVTFGQNMLLAEKSDMDNIIQAIEKIKKFSGDLAKKI